MLPMRRVLCVVVFGCVVASTTGCSPDPQSVPPDVGGSPDAMSADTAPDDVQQPADTSSSDASMDPDGSTDGGDPPGCGPTEAPIGGECVARCATNDDCPTPGGECVRTSEGYRVCKSEPASGMPVQRPCEAGEAQVDGECVTLCSQDSECGDDTLECVLTPTDIRACLDPCPNPDDVNVEGRCRSKCANASECVHPQADCMPTEEQFDACVHPCARNAAEVDGECLRFCDADADCPGDRECVDTGSGFQVCQAS